jgi:hypothetical protein
MFPTGRTEVFLLAQLRACKSRDRNDCLAALLRRKDGERHQAFFVEFFVECGLSRAEASSKVQAAIRAKPRGFLP